VVHAYRLNLAVSFDKQCTTFGKALKFQFQDWRLDGESTDCPTNATEVPYLNMKLAYCLRVKAALGLSIIQITPVQPFTLEVERQLLV
jgi:hypothetical protein